MFQCEISEIPCVLMKVDAMFSLQLYSDTTLHRKGLATRTLRTLSAHPPR
jgi:hypothetical protein